MYLHSSSNHKPQSQRDKNSVKETLFKHRKVNKLHPNQNSDYFSTSNTDVYTKDEIIFRVSLLFSKKRQRFPQLNEADHKKTDNIFIFRHRQVTTTTRHPIPHRQTRTIFSSFPKPPRQKNKELGNKIHLSNEPVK